MTSPSCVNLLTVIYPVTVVKLNVYKLRTSNLLLAVSILFICKLAGGLDIEYGKLTLPEVKIFPLPVELSIKDILNVEFITDVFEFLKR
jgi:hypothetical protein